MRMANWPVKRKCWLKHKYEQTTHSTKNKGVRNPMKMTDVGFLKAKPNQTNLKIQKPKTVFIVVLKNQLAVWGWFLMLYCLIHNTYCSMVRSTKYKVFFFMVYSCTLSLSHYTLDHRGINKIWCWHQWRFYIGAGGTIVPQYLALHPQFGMMQQLLSLWIILAYFTVSIKMIENQKFHCTLTDDAWWNFHVWKLHNLTGRSNNNGQPRAQGLWSIAPHPQFLRARTDQHTVQ